MDELQSLLDKYKITVCYIGDDENIEIKRYGITILYKWKDLYKDTPKTVVRRLIGEFIEHPDYIEKTKQYIQSLPKKQYIEEKILTIDEKKKLIREKLIKDKII